VHLVIPNQAEGPVRNLLFLAGCPIQASLWLEWGFQTLKTFPSIQRGTPSLDVIPNLRAFTSGRKDPPTTDLALRVETPSGISPQKQKAQPKPRLSERFFSLFPEYQINQGDLDIFQTL
jgi:hypothetical protein